AVYADQRLSGVYEKVCAVRPGGVRLVRFPSVSYAVAIAWPSGSVCDVIRPSASLTKFVVRPAGSVTEETKPPVLYVRVALSVSLDDSAVCEIFVSRPRVSY